MEPAPPTLGRYCSVQQGLPPRFLGEGSFGSVWEYADPTTGKRVAIKRLRIAAAPPADAARLYTNVERELTVHYILNHPHVVKMIDVFVSADGCLNVVMELVQGTLLSHVQGLQQQHGGSVPEPHARWFFQQLVVTLDYLHAKGVSHRDLKLENSLLQSSATPTMPLLKVADFGLSRFGVDAQTYVGTTEYLAPEVLELAFHHPQDDAARGYKGATADIFSAGVLLYAMLVGQYPYGNSHTLAARLRTMQAHTLPQQLRQRGRLSAEACDLLDQLLQPDPSQRITIEELKQHPWVTKGLPAAALKMKEDARNKPPASAARVSVERLQEVVTEVKQLLMPAIMMLPEQERRAVLGTA